MDSSLYADVCPLIQVHNRILVNSPRCPVSSRHQGFLFPYVKEAEDVPHPLCLFLGLLCLGSLGPRPRLLGCWRFDFSGGCDLRTPYVLDPGCSAITQLDLPKQNLPSQGNPKKTSLCNPEARVSLSSDSRLSFLKGFPFTRSPWHCIVAILKSTQMK